MFWRNSFIKLLLIKAHVNDRLSDIQFLFLRKKTKIQSEVLINFILNFLLPLLNSFTSKKREREREREGTQDEIIVKENKRIRRSRCSMKIISSTVDLKVKFMSIFFYCGLFLFTHIPK